MNTVARLSSALQELEEAIVSTRAALERQGLSSAQIVKHMEAYHTVLATQRRITNDLKLHLECGDWLSVLRDVNLICELSVMLRDDAQAMCRTADGPNPATHAKRLPVVN